MTFWTPPEDLCPECGAEEVYILSIVDAGTLAECRACHWRFILEDA